LSFTLVVDDFGIKYTNKDDVDHLLAAVRDKYPLKVDWEAKQYVGIHLQWDYTRREVICTMDGYVKQALKELQHTVPKAGSGWYCKRCCYNRTEAHRWWKIIIFLTHLFNRIPVIAPIMGQRKWGPFFCGGVSPSKIGPNAPY
jgi:hypothetical protein